MIQYAPKILMLGGLHVQIGDRVTSRFRTRKTACLLAYLAFYRRRVHTREELADMFWPDDEPDAARASLRTALNSLRNQLGPSSGPHESVLMSDRNSVHLRQNIIGSDVAEFEMALADAETAGDMDSQVSALRRAVQTYQGELLPEYYDEWILSERERLSSAYLGAIKRLLDHSTSHGHLDQALELTLRLVTADSVNESARADAMRLYQRMGKFNEAVRQYRELECILRDEFGAEPSEEVRAVYAELPERYRFSVSIRHRSRHLPQSRANSEEASTVTAASVRSQRLPVALTRFFGRESEIERVTGLLTSSLGSAVKGGNPNCAARLVTLVGPGGSGKTRLAVEAIHRIAGDFTGAIWYVPCAGLIDAQSIPDAVMDAVGAVASIADNWLVALSAQTAGSLCILVLDNLEHLLPEGIQYVHEMLVHVPEICCLVTSRSRLRVEGERVMHLSPLKTPSFRCKSPADVASCESVQLFVDRAQAARADFALTDRNAQTIAALCRRLDGLPLALEITASWAQVLTPAQMLDRTYEHIELLSRHRLGVSSRHMSLRAAIQWSFEQLSNEQKTLFARLAVFRSGCTVAAATAVCAENPGKGAAEDRMLSNLTNLAEASLVFTEEIETTRGPEIRFCMLETMREYAVEQISPTERIPLKMRHALYFIEVAEEYRKEVHQKYRDSLDADYDNLTAALQWAVESKHNEMALRLAISMYPHWIWRGRFAEGRRFLEKVSPEPGSDSSLAARALNAIGGLCYYMGDHACALKYYQMQLEIIRDSADKESLACALINVGNAEQGLGNTDEARKLIEEGLEALVSLDSRELIPAAQYNLAEILTSLEERENARGLYLLSYSGYGALDCLSGQGMCCRCLGLLSRLDGDLADARKWYAQSLDLEMKMGLPYGHKDTLQDLGNVLTGLGLHEAAATAFAQRALILEDDYNLPNA